MLNGSLRRQLLFFSAVGLITAVLAITLYSAFSLNRLAASNQERSEAFFTQQLIHQLEARLGHEALKIEQRLDQVAAIAQGLADTLTGLIKADAATQLSREDWSYLVRHALEAHESPVGTYVVWEPNAVDGADENYQGNLRHSDAEGRFGPYWTRSTDGSVDVRPSATQGIDDQNTNEWGIRPHEWYICPRDLGALCITDPGVWDVQGTPTLMASATTAVQVDGQFIGIAAADFSMAFAQRLAEQVQESLFAGHSELRLISHHGFLAADTANPEQIGEHYSSAQGTEKTWDEIRSLVQQGESTHWTTEGHLSLLVPMPLEQAGTPWSIEFRLPLDVALAEVTAESTLIASEFNQQIITQLLIGAFIILAALLLMAWVATHLARPLTQLTQLAENTAEDGDLTRRFDLNRKDEVGRLALALNRLQSNTQQAIAEAARQVNEMERLSEQNLQLVHQVDATLTNQQQQLEQSANALDQIATSATQVADLAVSTAQDSSQSFSRVNESSRASDKSILELSHLTEQLQHTLATLNELDAANAGIISMTGTINEISEQTNLLALNAAIEAARAGEQGRGFAVVADEVRQLASRTQTATAEIDQVLEKLNSKTQSVIAALNASETSLSSCKNQSEESNLALEKVQESSEQIEEAAAQIAAAAEQQSAATNLLLESFTDLHQKAHELKLQAQEAKQGSAQLETAAEAVKQQISRFKF